MATEVSYQQDSGLQPPSRPASSLSVQMSHIFQAHHATARQFFRQADTNGDDYIDFGEFRNLCRVLVQWRELYAQFDSNGDGALSLREFWRALGMFGYGLDPAFVERYFNEHAEVGPGGGEERALGFDGFVQSCIKLDRLRKVHQEYVSRLGLSPDVVPFEHLVGMVHKII